MKQRIGILGGTFNPVHFGHLIMGQDALEHFGLHRLLLVPAAQPPHKVGQALAPAAERLAMLRLAVAGDDRFEVWDGELARGGVSYTIDTLRALRDERPDADFHLVIGGDTLHELHTWREIHEVLSLCRVVTVARPGFPVAAPENLRLPDPWPRTLQANVVLGHLVEISSTDLRHRVAQGRGLRYLVPPAVEDYIARQGLYRPREERPSTP